MKLPLYFSLNPFRHRSKTAPASRIRCEPEPLNTPHEAGLEQSTTGETGKTLTVPVGRRERTSHSSTGSSKFAEDSNIGLKVLVDQPSDCLDCVDIVALHGLNGHRDLTWTDRVTGLNWLSDKSCLPKDVPSARILTFGYTSKTYFSRSKSDVQDFASELLTAINTRRQSQIERQRPLIFLCHSLGGLVFKQACLQ